MRHHRIITVALVPSFLTAAVSVGSSAGAIPPWVVHDKPGTRCPLSPPGSADAPYFKINGATKDPAFSCRQAGPFTWTINNPWFVQRINRLGPTACLQGPGLCYISLTRVCSRAAVGEHERTPTGTPRGPNGCSIYAPSAHASAIK